MVGRVATEEASKDEPVSMMQAGQPIEREDRHFVSSCAKCQKKKLRESGVGKTYDSIASSIIDIIRSKSSLHRHLCCIGITLYRVQISHTLANRTTRRDLPKADAYRCGDSSLLHHLNQSATMDAKFTQSKGITTHFQGPQRRQMRRSRQAVDIARVVVIPFHPS